VLAIPRNPEERRRAIHDMQTSTPLYPVVENAMRTSRSSMRDAGAHAATPSPLPSDIETLTGMFTEIEREVLAAILEANNGNLEAVIEHLLSESSSAAPERERRESDEALAAREQQELNDAMLLSAFDANASPAARESEASLAEREEQALAEAMLLSTQDRYDTRVARVREANLAAREHRLNTLGLTLPVVRERSLGPAIVPV